MGCDHDRRRQALKALGVSGKRVEGIGIQDCDLARIFDKIRQVDSGTVRRFEGSGLGLAIVRELARFLGGEVTVKSTPGEGSTFTVTLPLVTGETGVSPTLAGRAAAAGTAAGE